MKLLDEVYFSTTYDQNVQYYFSQLPIEPYLNCEGKLKIRKTSNIWRFGTQKQFSMLSGWIQDKKAA